MRKFRYCADVRISSGKFHASPSSSPCIRQFLAGKFDGVASGSEEAFHVCWEVGSRPSSLQAHFAKTLHISAVSVQVIRLHRLEVAGLSLEKCGLERTAPPVPQTVEV